MQQGRHDIFQLTRHKIMKLDLSIDRRRLQIDDARKDCDVWQEFIIAAVQQNQVMFASRLMQKEIGKILNKISSCENNIIELSEVERFVLINIFDVARFPVAVNSLLLQFYNRLEL